MLHQNFGVSVSLLDHLGFGRLAVGSSIASALIDCGGNQLCRCVQLWRAEVLLVRRDFWPGPNIELRLHAAWQAFLSWCQTVKGKKPRVTEFSGYLSLTRCNRSR